MRKTVLFQILLLLIGVFLVFHSSAQERTIAGKISDEKGNPLAGATVQLKNTRLSTTTDATGNFVLRVPAIGKTLVVSYVGMQELEVAMGSRTTFTISMKAGSSAMTDVVVIGYGSQRRKDINGAVSSVTAKDIAGVPQPSIDQMLQGRAAGVTVTQNSGTPGSATSVHVRGITSFGTSEPLYVIDGVAISGDASNSSTSGQSLLLQRPGGGQEEQGVSPLSLINPDDIESVDILKDASASAIYGSRGANGVIIITTRHGKNGNSHLTYNGYLGNQKQGKFLDMMSLPQYANLENVLADKFGTTRRGEFADPGLLGPGTNWQKAIFRTAPQASHQVSASGGKNGVDYYVSGGYFKQNGTIIGSDYNRVTFRTSVNAQVRDWFKLGTTLYGNNSNQHVGMGDNTGIIYNALLSAPDNPVYNADGTYAGPAVDAGGLAMGGINPVAQAMSITNKLGRYNAGGSIYGDLKFLRDFSLHSEINGDFVWSNAKTFNPTYTWGAFTNQTASLTEYNTNSAYWAWDEYLNYNHLFGSKHNLTATLGHEVWESTWAGVQNSASGFTAGNSIQTLSLASTISPPKENLGSQVMESFFGRAIYTFDNKYSLTSTIRRDRSSKFSQGNQTAYFPSAAVSWRVSEEPFMEAVRRVADNIKIRAGYGSTGNQSIANYLYGSKLNPVSTGSGTGFIIANIANPNLTWESSIQKNLGLDVGLLNERIAFSIDYFEKTSKNFLFSRPLPAFLVGGVAEYSSAAAITPPEVNAGELQNKGVELSITSKNIDKKDFRWTTTVVFSHYSNKVISLNGFPSLIGSVNSSYVSLPVTNTQVGGPVGEFYGYKVQGVIKTTAQLQYLAQHPQNVTGGATPPVITNDPNVANSLWLGDLQYQDLSGAKGKPDGQVDANDQVPLGNPNPDFTYSIANNFSYKGFELSVFLYGSHGGKILNALKYQTEGLSGLYANQLAEAINFWTPTNPNSNIPAPRAGIANNNLVMSDRFLESGSFLRIQNVKLTYNLPQKYIRHIAMSNLGLFVSGQNLHVFTHYSGLDPEIGSLNQNPTLMNIDMGRYPIPRTITFGINAQF